MASPFSFHCIVCFETFDPVERYPVVLKCGHTYVCMVCAERLDRCMECRTPLVEQTRSTTPNREQQQRTQQTPQRLLSASSAAGRRGGGRFTPPNTTLRKQEPPSKRRMPLPKNIVLLSLMEATTVDPIPEDAPSPVLNVALTAPLSDSDDSDEEEEKIRLGTSLATSVCGTYAVAAEEGLLLVPERPKHLSVNSPEGDVDTLVSFFGDLKGDTNRTFSTDEAEADMVEGAIRLRRGDRVQVVSMENGWAKLARGYGFVQANPGQLVKVGAAVDKACSLEAMLRSLSTRRRDLKMEQNLVESDFDTLLKGLQLSLTEDKDMTVINAAHLPQDLDEDDSSSVMELEMVSPRMSFDEDDAHLNDPSSDVALEKHTRLLHNRGSPLRLGGDRPETPPLTVAMERACFSADILGCGPSRPRLDASRAPSSLSLTLTPTNQDGIRRSNTSALDIRRRPFLTAEEEREFARLPFPHAFSAASRALIERRNSWCSPGRGVVDFRTGLSGHMALSSSRPAQSSDRPRTIKTMSNHSGLGVILPSLSSKK